MKVFLSLLVISIFFFVRCIDREKKKIQDDQARNGYAQYAGSAACAGCHKDIYQTHIHTAHYLTSAASDTANVKGSTQPGSNRFYYDPGVYIDVTQSRDSFYQVEYAGGSARAYAPMNITVGSGKRGQTFLYWYHNELFQLPLTWFTSLHQWTNSPGFSNRVIFRRPVTSRCLECHSTYFQTVSAAGGGGSRGAGGAGGAGNAGSAGVEPEEFSRTAILYGVDCEKCHGPGAKHVAWQKEHPEEKTGQYIVALRNFSREQSLDLCRLCHGGRLAKTRSSFSFQPGDRLADYFRIDSVAPNAADIDVHGNQYGMLASSRCFKESGMTCLTCHSPHANETGKLELFSQRCLSCHGSGGKDGGSNAGGSVDGGDSSGAGGSGAHVSAHPCKMTALIGARISQNCIDCHMPVQPSRSIMVLLQGESVPTSASMRSHFISIYPEATKTFLHKK